MRHKFGLIRNKLYLSLDKFEPHLPNFIQKEAVVVVKVVEALVLLTDGLEGACIHDLVLLLPTLLILKQSSSGGHTHSSSLSNICGRHHACLISSGMIQSLSFEIILGGGLCIRPNHTVHCFKLFFTQGIQPKTLELLLALLFA